MSNDVTRSTLPSSPFAAPPESEDPARQIGEIFRRLSLAAETFPSTAFCRVAAAVHVALGRAAMEEAERQADRLRQRTAPPSPGIRVTSTTTRRVDFDGGFDIDDRG